MTCASAGPVRGHPRLSPGNGLEQVRHKPLRPLGRFGDLPLGLSIDDVGLRPLFQGDGGGGNLLIQIPVLVAVAVTPGYKRYAERPASLSQAPEVLLKAVLAVVRRIAVVELGAYPVTRLPGHANRFIQSSTVLQAENLKVVARSCARGLLSHEPPPGG